LEDAPVTYRSGVKPKLFRSHRACRRYLAPLIKGEDYPPYKDGLPVYVQLKNVLEKKKLPAWEG
jgi:6-phosphofructokinase 1